MKEIFVNLKYQSVCRRKRNQMIKTYLNGVYFQFDSDNHVQFCLKCQTAGKSLFISFIIYLLAGAVRLELTTSGFGDPRSAN